MHLPMPEQEIFFHFPSDPPQAKKALNHFWLKIAKITAVIGAILISVSYLPSIWYSVRGAGGSLVSKYLLDTAKVGNSITVNGEGNYEPPVDPLLPTQNWITIPSIGVDSTINEATYENYEDALKKGIWRASDYGTPANQEKPTILAAHRFGYLKWSNTYRRKNSFFNLTKLKEGDTITVIWRQRKYTYAVYAETEGTEIEDYNAELILYTCKDLSSDVRLFVYARLLRV